MPEVSGSSSHGAHAVTTAGNFDLHSQKGVAHILKQLRSSNLPPETKTAIRELVLKFAQTSGNAGVRKDLEVLLGSVSLAPAIPPENQSNTPDAPTTPDRDVSEPPARFGFSGARPVPHFSPSREKSVSSIATPIRTTVTPNQSASTVPPTSAPQPTAVPVTETSVPQAPPEERPVPTPQAETARVSDVSSADRILEIKREVISLVGNPVNLVDIDNAIGKQYMTALLEAMKKTNGGTKTEAAAAMSALEAAFVAVKGVAKRTEKPAFEPAPENIPTPPASTIPPTSAPQPTIVPVTKTSVPPVPTSQLSPPPPPAVPESVKENLVQDSEQWAELAAEQHMAADSTDNMPVNDIEAKNTQALGGVPLQDIPTYGYSRPNRSVSLPPKPTPPPAPVFKEPEAPEPPPAPATTKRTQSIAEQSTASVDLMTPDITVGLTQLLAEWKIFKGSGLFGMGPGGIDHPLYKNIKDNSMLSIMNGTFTGATGEIQQSINDYINGWRYEQSIVPQHSETFDHFLRRVVRKVLHETKR